MKKVFYIVMAFALFAVSCEQPNSGNDQTNPDNEQDLGNNKVVTTADEFITILSNTEFLLNAAETDEIRIAGNLDFTGKTLPEDVAFTGTLNGQNFKLSNIPRRVIGR